MTYVFEALTTDICAAWRAGGPDANGKPPERAASDGGGNPCRHCLNDIPAGRQMLILAHRPFTHINPYAEIGPIFICAACERLADSKTLPPVLASRARHLLKGYSSRDRIVGGTGEIVETANIAAYVDRVFSNPAVKFIDVRSSANNCFTLRINRKTEEAAT